MGARFEITWVGNGRRCFRLKDPDGEVLLESGSYKTAPGCLNGIASCREHAPFDRFYVRELKGTTQLTFRLKAANNREIGRSSLFGSIQKRELKIETIKVYAPIADVYDSTK